MSERQYSSLLVQILSSNFLPQIREAALAHPIGGMFWKAISPEIPHWLTELDNNKELQANIIRTLREFMALLEENEGAPSD